MKKLFTSESVTEGHPDKVCDQISDGILDEILSQDRYAHTAIETFCTRGLVVIMGEVSADAAVNYEDIARLIINDIGYDDPRLGFDGTSSGVLVSIHSQSPDIAMGVERAYETRMKETSDKAPCDTDISGKAVCSGDEFAFMGAGDQGIMFGYATDETPEYMPLSQVLSNSLCMRLAELRKEKGAGFLRPDGKAQVTVELDDTGNPFRIDAVVVSAQHDDDIELKYLREFVMKEVIEEVVPAGLRDSDTKYFINPTGKFSIGGPAGDTGLTGRKIIIDTYGGAARHGGGAFSGKDPTKVDRSAAYALRHAAKNVVAAGLAHRCELQAAYAIGVARPVSLMAETFGTGAVSDTLISEAVMNVFDLRPAAIIGNLDLLRPIYRDTSVYGHFGREEENFTWEKLDKVSLLKQYIIEHSSN